MESPRPGPHRAQGVAADDALATFGRGDELALFDGLLATERPPFRMLHVFGPPGIGKSHLLTEYARRCAGQVRAITLTPGAAAVEDARAFERAVASAVGADDALSAWGMLAEAPTRTVIFVDDADPLLVLRVSGHRLSEGCLLVVASRQPPRYASSASAEYARHVRPLRLRDLDFRHARAMLEARGVPTPAHEPILALAGGHPLALSIAASMRERSAQEMVAFVTDALLALSRQGTCGPEDIATLELAAVAPVVREDLLCALGDPSSAAAQFEWLRSLSRVEAVAGGLALHPTFRRAILADLRWRNPTRFASLVGRAREHLLTQIRTTTGAQQDRAVEDYARLGSDACCGGDALTMTVVEPSADQATAAVAICAEHEGQNAARLIADWSRRVLGSLRTVTDATGAVCGFLLALTLAEARAHADEVGDPAAVAFLQSAARGGSPSERSLFVRAWMARGGHQTPGPIAALLLAQVVKWQLGPSPVDVTYLALAQPSAFDAALAAVGVERVRGGGFRSGEIAHELYRFDWRSVSPATCLSALTAPETVTTSSATGGPARRIARDELASAVRDALRWYGDTDALSSSPLLSTPMVARRAGGSASHEQRVAALRALLSDAITALSRTPKRAKLRRALERAYVAGAPTQEQAAQLLDLPLSTYRRHLREGEALVVDFLWRRNLEGPFQ